MLLDLYCCPQTKLREGTVFTPVCICGCVSQHALGEGVSQHAVGRGVSQHAMGEAGGVCPGGVHPPDPEVGTPHPEADTPSRDDN